MVIRPRQKTLTMMKETVGVRPGVGPGGGPGVGFEVGLEVEHEVGPGDDLELWCFLHYKLRDTKAEQTKQKSCSDKGA